MSGGIREICALPLAHARRALIRPLVGRLPRWVTPNGLVFARLAGAGIVAALFLAGQVAAAFVVYLAALATDALDGELARVRGRVSRLGARLDASIDKVLQSIVFLAFLTAAPLLILTILLLDVLLLVIGLVLVALPRSRALDVTASAFGKWKLAAQAAALVLLFVSALFRRPAPSIPLRFLLALALVFALLSFLEYVRRVPQVRAPA